MLRSRRRRRQSSNGAIGGRRARGTAVFIVRRGRIGVDEAELALLLFAGLLRRRKACTFAFDVGRSRLAELTAVLTLGDWAALLRNGEEFSFCTGIVQQLATILGCFRRRKEKNEGPSVQTLGPQRNI